MTADEVLVELATLGSDSIKKVLMRHGAKEPFYGVKVEDLKKIQKRIKKDHTLALELYDTGVSDAMYLAGLICEPSKMKKSDLKKWVKNAYWHMLAEYTVAWVAAESPYGAELAAEWIDSPKETIAGAGWATYSSLASIKPDEELDLDVYAHLLDRVKSKLSSAPNRVRYSMNCFLIAVGSYIKPLAARAKSVAKSVGKVEVDVGDTACKVPDAVEYIKMIEERGTQGKKRKSAFC
jgi:3-methyladenine DNA glycosylase AlkD